MDIKVNVTVNAPELASAIQALADALSKPMDVCNWLAQNSGKTIDTDTTVKEGGDKPAAESEPDRTPDPQPEPEPEPEPEPDPDPAPVITLEQVRAKLAAISQSGKQAQVKQLLNSFGATKLTEVPAKQYANLLAGAEEIA